MMVQAHSIEVKFCEHCNLPHVYLFEEDEDEPFAMFTIDEDSAEAFRTVLGIRLVEALQ